MIYKIRFYLFLLHFCLPMIPVLLLMMSLTGALCQLSP